MLTLLLAGAALVAQQRLDTTFTVSSGARLHANAFGGSISVRAWSKNAVRVSAEHGSRDRVTVRWSGDVITVAAEGRYGPPPSVDYTIDVPDWMAVSVEGVNTDLTVRGTKAAVSAETVQGDVTVDGGADQVTASSVSGDVKVSGVHGRVNASSTNQDVTVVDVVGDVTAEGTNGDVILQNITASAVDANSLNGDVRYDGTIQDGGHYRLTTHNGDVTVSIDEHTNATVSVATFSGDFETPDFPVHVSEMRKGRRFSFTLGSGSAKVELESFDGTIALRRPGEMRTKHQAGHKDKEL